MKVELQHLTGVLASGTVVEFDRWQVFATGPDGNRVLVGYLDFDEQTPLMLLCPQPMNVVRELIEKCSAIVKREVKSPIPVVMPPVIDNTAGEDDEAEYGDD